MDTRYELAPWVEVQVEQSRLGGRTTIAVNKRDGVALLCDDLDADALRSALEDGGFIAGNPPSVPPPPSPLGARFLRTLDARTTRAGPAIEVAYRLLRPVITRRTGHVAQVTVALLGVVCVVHRFLVGDAAVGSLHVHAAHIPAYVALSLLSVVAHETGHAVVVAHHGRRVASVGFRVHLGAPSFYVESVEALLLDRTVRIRQALAGPWSEWLFVSFVAAATSLVPGLLPVDVARRFVVVSIFTIALNLLPFAGLDGSFVAADLLRVPNLAQRAYGAVARRADSAARPGDLWLLAYAVCNGAVSCLLVLSSLGLWWAMFGGLVRTVAALGPVGVVVDGVALTFLFGPAIRGSVRLWRRFDLVDRWMFRREVPVRVRFATALASSAAFSGLGADALSRLAGEFRVVRVRRWSPLHAPDFRGLVLADSHLVVHGAPSEGATPVHRAVRGVAVSCAGRRGGHCVLLPDERCEVVVRTGPVGAIEVIALETA